MSRSLRDLRALVTLAEERHFGRAAEKLGMAQPQLSDLIARFETSIGVPLFIRRPQVAPTKAGLMLVGTARLIFTEFERGVEKARHIHSGQEGLVRVGFVSSVMLTELPQAFSVFRRRYPVVQFTFLESNSIGLANGVVDDLIDVGFARQTWDRDDLQSDPVFAEPFVAVHPEGWENPEKPFNLLHFRNEPFILFPPEVAPRFHGEIIAVCHEAGFVPRIAHVANGWPAALALVRSGFGVTVGPACLQRLNWPGLAFRELGAFHTRTTISMVRRRSLAAPAALNFVRLLRENI
jgi:DNA-binding transcriptional LysR family regulator